MRERSRSRVLVTGFEPFGGAFVNPSGEVAKALDGALVAGAHVKGAVLPVLYEGAPAALLEQLRVVRPQIVVSLGMAGPRFRVEQLASDLDHASAADNAGVRRDHHRGHPDEPMLLPTTLPVREVEDALMRAVGPTPESARDAWLEPSEDAGGFVCNHVFYALMRAAGGGRLARAGFIHVPHPDYIEDYAPGGVVRGPPGLSQQKLTGAIASAVAAIAVHLERGEAAAREPHAAR